VIFQKVLERFRIIVTCLIAAGSQIMPTLRLYTYFQKVLCGEGLAGEESQEVIGQVMKKETEASWVLSLQRPW
jgi:hypothetical protein